MIRKLRKELITSIKNRRLNVFLLFLFSAFAILVFTKLSKEYTNTIAFNIKKINVPQDKVILKDSNQELRIRLKTHGFKWLRYYLSKPDISIDFSNEVYSTGTKYVYTKPLSYLNEKKQFQKQVKLLDVSPDTLLFRFDTNMVKKIPIIVQADIDFAPGFDVLGHYRSEPDSIVVIGPHAIVNTLEFLETETVTLTNIKMDISEKTSVVLPENQSDLKFSAEEVTLVADVEKFTEGMLKIPITLVNVPQGTSVKCFPKEVNVSYYTSLDNFNNIKPKNFKVVCDFKKVGGNQTFLIPELTKFPGGAKYIKLNEQRVEFIILK